MNLNPYLNFRGQAREALEFYQSVFGGDVEANVFSEYPDMGVSGDEADWLMHGQLKTADGLVLMASDVPTGMDYAAPAGFAVSVSGSDEDKLQSYWDGLSAGGTVTMPYDTPPWGGKFGMLTDKYGVDWMVATGDD